MRENPLDAKTCYYCGNAISFYPSESDEDEPAWDAELDRSIKQLRIIRGMMVFSLFFSLFMLVGFGIAYTQGIQPGFFEPIQTTEVYEYQYQSMFGLDLPLFIPVIANPLWIIALVFGIIWIKRYPYKTLLIVTILMMLHAITSAFLLPLGFLYGSGGFIFFLVCIANLKPAFKVEQEKKSL